MQRVRYLLAVVALVALAGCAGGEPGSTPIPAACEAADGLQASIQAVRDVDRELATAHEMRVLVEDVDHAWDVLMVESAGLAEPQSQALSAAVLALGAAARELPEGTTMEEAVALLQEEIQAVGTAFEAFRSALGCTG
jgi:hypothetical protein